MKKSLLLAVAFSAVLASNVWAQDPAPKQAAPAHAAALAAMNPASSPDDGRLPGDQRIEKLHVQDSDNTITETRVGGVVQNTTVTPKGRAPAYEIQPTAPNKSMGGGARVWTVFKF